MDGKGKLACCVLMLASFTFATQANAQQKTVNRLLATKPVQAAKQAGHSIFKIQGCVNNVPQFVITHCKYVTMNNVNYSAAVLSEVPAYVLALAVFKVPIDLSAPQIPPGTAIVGIAGTLNGPSVDCAGAPVYVTGSIVLAWQKTGVCTAK